MWWTADMSGAELSMSPWDYTQVTPSWRMYVSKILSYAHLQWRDHWLQAVQLLPEPLNVKKGKILKFC